MKISTNDERIVCTTVVARMIATHGPIPCVRVSSAQARGAAKKYSYWGAVRYEVRLRLDGVPTYAALGRARSDRRSEALAHRDAEELARSEGRLVVVAAPGPLSEATAEGIIRALRDGAS